MGWRKISAYNNSTRSKPTFSKKKKQPNSAVFKIRPLARCRTIVQRKQKSLSGIDYMCKIIYSECRCGHSRVRRTICPEKCLDWKTEARGLPHCAKCQRKRAQSRRKNAERHHHHHQPHVPVKGSKKAADSSLQQQHRYRCVLNALGTHPQSRLKPTSSLRFPPTIAFPTEQPDPILSAIPTTYLPRLPELERRLSEIEPPAFPPWERRVFDAERQRRRDAFQRLLVIATWRQSSRGE